MRPQTFLFSLKETAQPPERLTEIQAHKAVNLPCLLLVILGKLTSEAVVTLNPLPRLAQHGRSTQGQLVECNSTYRLGEVKCFSICQRLWCS